jgi:Ca2+-binding RTX toxin-like protein
MIYAGNDLANVVEVRLILAGAKYRIEGNGPIQAQAGCSPVSGDPTSVTCTAFRRPDGTLKEFHVLGRNGPDTISNFSPATMVARGEGGPDDLSGGGGNDTLDGGLDDRDDLRGNGGADVLDGGPGEHDGVSYSGRMSDTFVSLDGVANDGDGTGAKADNVLPSVEDVAGGNGHDTIIGSHADNVIAAGDGSDTVIARPGADIVIGGRGSDLLFANEFGSPIGDGAVDQLSGGGLLADLDPGAIDTCVISTSDSDIAKFCEQ